MFHYRDDFPSFFSLPKLSPDYKHKQQGTTSEAGNAHPSGALEFTPGF